MLNITDLTKILGFLASRLKSGNFMNIYYISFFHVLFVLQNKDTNSPLMHETYLNSIYTHNYDDTGTRLFTAGGPMPSDVQGNYAGIWS